MTSLKLQNEHCYSVKYSPFYSNKLAIVTSENYGFQGSGYLHILDTTNNSTLNQRKYKWQNGLYDLSFSKAVNNLLATGSSDGSLQLWDLDLEQNSPLKVFKENSLEISSLDWYFENFVSSSWDGNIKIWNPNLTHSINTLHGHTDIVYQVECSNNPNQRLLASVSGDGKLIIWNCNINNHILFTKHISNEQILTCSWNKFEDKLLTGTAHGIIQYWDLRNLSNCLFQSKQQSSAIKKVLFSPHFKNIFLSIGFDLSIKVWDCSLEKNVHKTQVKFPTINGSDSSLEGCVEVIKNHSEFIYGMDFSYKQPGWCVSCGWDSVINFFKPNYFSLLS